MFGYIYLTTNTINQKKYIGQRKIPKNKSIEEDNYLGSGVLLKKAILAHGKENFIKEIIHTAESQEKLDQLEIEEIKNRNAMTDKGYYNIASGGAYKKDFEFSIDSKEKLSVSAKRRCEDPEYLERLKELSRKGGESFKKKFEENGGYDQETLNKMSERVTGPKNPMFGSKMTDEKKHKLLDANRKDWNRGRVLSEEWKRKIGESSRKALQDPDVKRRMLMNRNKYLDLTNMTINAFDDADKQILFKTFNGLKEFRDFYSNNSYDAELHLKRAIKNFVRYKGHYWDAN